MGQRRVCRRKKRREGVEGRASPHCSSSQWVLKECLHLRHQGKQKNKKWGKRRGDGDKSCLPLALTPSTSKPKPNEERARTHRVASSKPIPQNALQPAVKTSFCAHNRNHIPSHHQAISFFFLFFFFPSCFSFLLPHRFLLYPVIYFAIIISFWVSSLLSFVTHGVGHYASVCSSTLFKLSSVQAAHCCVSTTNRLRSNIADHLQG